MNFQRLFQPITINNMTLKNRLVMTTIHLLYTEDGIANDRFNQFYWRRAEGGVAMVIVGGTAFENHRGYTSMLRIDSDEFIPSFKEFTDGMHQRGAKVTLQLLHTGRYGRSEFVDDDDAVIAPSAVYSAFSRETPRAMTIEEIKQVVRRGAEGAVRAQKAGFDAVEIMGSSGYLISEFLSPSTNLREDEYGGSWENRCRFPLEFVSAIRAAVGPDFPLLVRIAGNEFVTNGNTSNEAVEFAKALEKAGVDMINVTGGWHETKIPQLPGDVPRGGYVYLAQKVKDAVSIPVLSANRHNDPFEAEKVLALGQADLIGLARTLIADPDWPNKAKEGCLDEIRRCVACNQGCLAKVFFDQPAECLVNGYAGREYLFVDTKPLPQKRLLVIGGGPAGCEFAIQTAQRGHEVTLWEKGPCIGGQLQIASVPPAKHEFNNLTRYYDAMLKSAGVQVMLNKEAHAEEIRKSGFDAVILATGVTPNRIKLPGNSKTPVYTAIEILEQKAIAGRNVVFVGGSAVGCETADYLAREASLSEEGLYFMMSQQSESIEMITDLLNTSRRNIAIVDIAKVGAGFDPGCGWPVMKDLKRLSIKQYPFSNIVEVTDDKVIIDVNDKKTGKVTRKELPCDTIVMAVGSKSNNALYESVKDCSIPVYNIGDSAKVGKVIDAIRQADDLAMKF